MRERKQEEQQMEESKVLRVIRDGKLYDTGKAEYLATIWTKLDSIESRTCFGLHLVLSRLICTRATQNTLLFMARVYGPLQRNG